MAKKKKARALMHVTLTVACQDCNETLVISDADENAFKAVTKTGGHFKNDGVIVWYCRKHSGKRKT